MTESWGSTILQDPNGGLIVLDKHPFDRFGREHADHLLPFLLTTNELVVGEGFSDLEGFNVVVGLIWAINPEECLAYP